MKRKRLAESPRATGVPPVPEHNTGKMPVAHGALRQRAVAPDPAAPIPAVRVGFVPRHPAIYRKRIDKVERAKAGDLVAVYGPEGKLLGYGLYNPRSEIAVRMLFQGDELPDDARWQERLEQAVGLRRGLLRLDEVADAYRLIHAEADGLPGLVVDRFGEVLSAEVFTLGMYQRAEALLARLAAMCNTRHVLVRGSPQFLSQEGQEPPEIASPELPEQVTIHEHGTRFRVRFAGGHKTGFFCDQRENRRRLAEFSVGRTVLDLCCYTGGFAVQAMRLGKAAEATGVDLDEEPLRIARENANLNHVRARFVQADAFTYMREMIALGRQFDVVVLDPPKLVRSRARIGRWHKKTLRSESAGDAAGAAWRADAELLLLGPGEGAGLPRPALFGRLPGRAAGLSGHRRGLRAARSAADADPGPHRRRGRSPRRLQRPGERVSQGGVDAPGVSAISPLPLGEGQGVRAGGETYKRGNAPLDPKPSP